MQSGLQFLSILASGILSPDTKTMLQVALKLKRQLYKEGNLEGCVNVTTSKEGIELGPGMKLEKNRQFVGKARWMKSWFCYCSYWKWEVIPVNLE